MNPFRPLLKLLDFVLGHDLHERAPEQKRAEVRRSPRTAAPQGDGFDSGAGGPRVDLRGGVKVAPKLPDEPAGPPAVIEASNFNASLDDLSQLVDEPMEPRPEFVPEGGMSTESLMREFSALDAETQATAVELAAAKELAQAIELEDPEKFVDSFEPVLPPGTSLPLLAAQGEGVQTPAWLMPATAPAPKPIVPLPPPELSTESLMSEFESLTPEAQQAAIEEAAARELARQEAEEAEEEALAPLPAAQGEGVQTPAWLMPATAPAPKPVVSVRPPELSTESLMSEFESLTPEAQQAAIEEAAAKELARQEAERDALAPVLKVGASPPVIAPGSSPLPSGGEGDSFVPRDQPRLVESLPAPQGEGVQTPAWLIPATAPAPKPAVPLPPPELSTESLMNEFESLDAETQQAAIDEAAARELARQQAEEAKKKALAAEPTAPPLAGEESEH